MSTMWPLLGGVALWMVACSAERPVSPAPETTSGPVATVVVELAEPLRARPDKRARFEAVDGALRLKQVMEEALARQGKLEARSPRTLRVEVVEFRLRSAFTAGLITGPDVLDLALEVREGDEVVRRFTAGAGTQGTGFAVSPRRRFEKVIRRTAERVAGQL